MIDDAWNKHKKKVYHLNNPKGLATQPDEELEFTIDVEKLRMYKESSLKRKGKSPINRTLLGNKSAILTANHNSNINSNTNV